MLIGLIVACCGQAFADDKVTYSSDVHPTQIYSLKSFYDIDGDGILEVVGNKSYRGIRQNQTSFTTAEQLPRYGEILLSETISFR